MTSTTVIRIVHPSGPDKHVHLPERIRLLESRGFVVRHTPPIADPEWTFTSASVTARTQIMADALLEPDTHVIWAARGGYGASDLLAHLPWDRLVGIPPKLVVGFSDTSALHSALLTRLGWKGLHAPMPSSELWGHDEDFSDIEQSLTCCRASHPQGTIAIKESFHAPQFLSGWLFGGCASVLTNLIGTPYFPPDLSGALLFWEDIGEPPPRVVRFFNQWEQSGSFAGVRGLVLGRFLPNNGKGSSTAGMIAAELSRRTRLPLFVSDDFGHCAPNRPLMVGSSATIKDGQLAWMKELVA